MQHFVNIEVSPADIFAAAQDAGLTVSQFEAKAINDAVQAYKRKQNGFAELMDAVRNAAPEE